MLSRIDYKAQYCPEVHRPVILKMINEFQAIDLNLVITDAVTAISGMGVFFLLRLLSAGWFPWMIAVGAGYFVTDTITERSRYRKNFLDQLSELLKTYQWCCETGGNKITSDETLLDLLEAIAPFIQDGKKLVPKGIPYSPDFKHVLSQSPHNVQFFEEKKTEFSVSTLIGSAIRSRLFKEEPQPNVQRPLQERVYSHARLKFYGEPKPGDNKKIQGVLNQLSVEAITVTVDNFLKKFK